MTTNTEKFLKMLSQCNNISVSKNNASWFSIDGANESNNYYGYSGCGWYIGKVENNVFTIKKLLNSLEEDDYLVYCSCYEVRV